MSLNLPEYTFRNNDLLETALTHRSAGRDNNERLEYLGDSALGFIITEYLFLEFPSAQEGALTRLRANLVKRETLARLARELDLGSHIRLGPGERKSGGWRRDSILANALESIIGAIYLDSDLAECKRFIMAIYRETLDELDLAGLEKDPKTVLQELLQARKMPLPVYQIVREQGEAHDRTFTVSCEIAGLDQRIIGDGRSKRSAEQSAASNALKLMESES